MFRKQLNYLVRLKKLDDICTSTLVFFKQYSERLALSCNVLHHGC